MSYTADSIQISNQHNYLKGKIYIIKNNINSKVYIGQTINTLKHRFNQHARVALEKCNKNSIDYAIQTLGKENFWIEEIETCDYNELDEKEIYWINFYNSFENGYNMTLGGQLNRPNKIDNETFSKIVEDYNNGILMDTISKKYNIHNSTIYEYFKNNKIKLQGNNRKESISQSIENIKKATLARQIKVKNIDLQIIYSSKKEALLDMIEKGYSKSKDWHNIRSGLDKALKEKIKFLNFKWEIIDE